ncbi:MYG1 family protein [Weissella paramesenteroides]|uniref:MYG1 family protein n=1 Tax=Weissella paramesenteroides TaxID=1249 RepID=UPI001239C382|nr:MYG1 family protein [Weissella paramesenteroides]KAA8455836.1 MYG1 family protein [Weissella paramesenteroides]KAA8457124.1 MYG1 family protein [Weissella paramesenteroides]KAA8457751.1 MYG1 family protein [Weissella paramesenteroides]KAA8460306.1 MYG1 family protein [Weissella paramesenteroides]KAA8461222.1 MYG1 family protein [Weissella paramesenteroides]
MYKNLVTHNGKFHADDVFASVIMTQLFPELTIIRTRDEVVTDDHQNFVYDVGGGEFDHHGIDDTRQHQKGVPMAAFGLIWQTFGQQYIEKLVPDLSEEIIKSVHRHVDSSFVIGIDALDNGVSEYQSEVFTVPDVINDFYEEDDETNSFNHAVACATLILENRVKKTVAKQIAQQAVIEQAIFVSNQILLLPISGPWKDYAEQFDQLVFVVLPRKDGNWMIQGVPVTHGSFEVKHAIPQVKEDGIVFIHRTGFMAVVDTQEHALQLAQQVLDGREN